MMVATVYIFLYFYTDLCRPAWIYLDLLTSIYVDLYASMYTDLSRFTWIYIDLLRSI